MPRRHAHIALIYGRTGQVVPFYPPDAEVIAEGAAAAATYSVWRGTQSNEQTPLFTGTATLDAVSTTISGSTGYSQANRRSLTVAATTGFVVGERYLASQVYNSPQREIVTVATATTATGATVEEDLSFDYPASSTFKGLLQTFTIDATFITTPSNINIWGAYQSGLIFPTVLGEGTKAPSFRVRWVYVTGGTTTRESWTTFDVVRKPAKSNLSFQDLRPLLPEATYREWSSQRGQDFAPQLQFAEERLEIDIRAAGYDQDGVPDQQIWTYCLKLGWQAAIAWALLSSGGREEAWMAKAEDRYKAEVNRLFAAARVAQIDVGTTGTTAVSPMTRLSLKER